ncbi:MAG: ferrous iron transport protein A [Ruminococcus sp.]|nr:ferrous iron transport protein A [Ruminococcus sp.]
MNITLDKVRCGHNAVIISIKDSEYESQKLHDMGLTKGSEILPVFSSPTSDPVAYKVNGVVIAIRNKQAKNINVSTCRCDSYEKA